MTENALKCKFNGGTVPIGYTINKDQFFEVDPVKAPYVVEAFRAYANGKTIKEIRDMLNAKGVTTSLGSKITINIVTDMLKNRRYIGEYKFRDIVQKDGIPRIVPQALFDKVQIEREKNKRATARHTAKDDYLLLTTTANAVLIWSVKAAQDETEMYLATTNATPPSTSTPATKRRSKRTGSKISLSSTPAK